MKRIILFILAFIVIQASIADLGSASASAVQYDVQDNNSTTHNKDGSLSVQYDVQDNNSCHDGICSLDEHHNNDSTDTTQQ